MKMKPFITCVLLSLLACGTLQARTLTPTEALDRAMNYSNYDKKAQSAKHNKDMHKLVYTSPRQAFYVFSRSDDGYMIASGDDRFRAVLADVSHGTFNPDSLAPQPDGGLTNTSVK